MSFADLYFEQSQRLQERLDQAEGIVLALRRKLREIDPSLPDEHDGPAWWAAIEGGQ